jgi:hypothetical protein
MVVDGEGPLALFGGINSTRAKGFGRVLSKTTESRRDVVADSLMIV